MTRTIAINTPTGKVGAKVASRLLDAGADVVLLARDPAKVETLAARGAKVEVGSLDDAAFVRSALAGVDAVYWANPFGVGADGTVHGSFAELGRIAADAIAANRVERVVQLGVLDIHPKGGAGDIPAGVATVERLLEAAAAHVTHVRATYFFENFLMQIPNLASGQLRMPVSPATRIPMIASADVAAIAARELLDPNGSGHRAIGAHGPADLSFDEARAAIGRGLGREVGFETISPLQAFNWATSMGVPGPIAEALVALYGGFDRGAFTPDPPRSADSTTSTSLEAFARGVISPALAAATAA